MLCLLRIIIQNGYGQGSVKKPTLTILPSDNWCAARYFMTTYDNQGTEVKIPDYLTAFQQDSELPMVIANVGALLTDFGYSVKDAEQELKAITARAQEDNVTTSSTSRSYLAESPLDVLKRRVKADILLQIWWKVNKESVGHSPLRRSTPIPASASPPIAAPVRLPKRLYPDYWLIQSAKVSPLLTSN